MKTNQNTPTLFVVTHKNYRMPKDALYVPIQVGSGDTIHAEWLRDNTEDNISDKNLTFCELTALYWVWKNTDADVVGLCHYRRYLGSPKSGRGGRRKKLLSSADIEFLLNEADVILPRKRHYYIETRESQYVHAHHAKDIECVEAILTEKFPEYLAAWERMKKSRSGHICNMFVMPRKRLDDYCKWLFAILFEAEKRLDISTYNENDRRVFGYLAERLLDVWIDKNGLRTVEVPMLTLEDQHWLKKGSAFLWRKFFAKKK